jgi:ribosomal protein S18 acetylase RimI-like enzyme
MNFPTWDPQQTQFLLGENYSLERADPTTFAIHFTTAELAHNVWFRQSWDQLVGRFAAEDICFWIMHNQQRIGGVCIEPNLIGCLFLEPPHTELDQVLYLLKGLLLRWSDPSKPIGTQSVNADQLAAYCRIGFRISEIRRVMIRVTEPLPVTWPAGFEMRQPTPADAETLAALFHECYAGGTEARSQADAQGNVDYYFQHNAEPAVLQQASTICIDSQSKEMIATCLISLWEGWPLVYDVVVQRKWRGQGLANAMLRQALNTLHTAYPVLRLFVTVGNPAEAVYHKLGFVAGPESYWLRLST